MRRPFPTLLLGLVLVAGHTAGLGWLFVEPKPPPGAPRVQKLYLNVCAPCHGADGRGTWRAALFFLKPGDLGDPGRTGQLSDDYLFELIKKGGSPLGKPGMPGYEGQLSDDEIRALVRYVRGFASRRAG